MATIGYTAPRLVGSGNIKEPKQIPVLPAQNAAWRRGGLVVQATTGSITNAPGAGTGSLASYAGPAASAVTLGNNAASGAPAQSYFIIVTYTATSAESQPSQTFIQNCPAGYVPSINVASAGAPGSATNYAAYVGLLPGTSVLQQATKTTTALGTAFNCAYPLTNYIGANQGATNLSSGLLGLALTDSTASFYGGPGGAFTAGQNNSLFGSTNTMPPIAPLDAPYLYVAGLGANQLVEFNLVNTQVLTPNLNFTTAGVTLDSTTGIFVVDPSQSNKIFTITGAAQGVSQGPTASGTIGDLGARIVGYFNSGLAAV